MSNKIIEVQNIKINITNLNEKDCICISDIAKAKSDKSRAADVIRNWLRNRSTLDFLTAWEELYNPNFKANILMYCDMVAFVIFITLYAYSTILLSMFSEHT